MSRKPKPVRAEAPPEEPVEAAGPVEPAGATEPAEAPVETSAAVPAGPATQSPAQRQARALIDAAKASGFPAPPAALKALNEETA